MEQPRQIGLPPLPEKRPPTSKDLWLARGLNVFGLVSPAANLGMVRWCTPDVRWFGVGAGVICAVGIGWGSYRDVPWLVTGGWTVHYSLVLLGLLHPLWPAAVARAWNLFGVLIGKVMIYPMFALIYYGAVTPTALLVRLLAKDPLARNAPPGESYWTKHTSPEREQYERQF